MTAAQFKQKRIDLGMTQEELAEEMVKHIGEIKKLESGEKKICGMTEIILKQVEEKYIKNKKTL